MQKAIMLIVYILYARLCYVQEQQISILEKTWLKRLVTPPDYGFYRLLVNKFDSIATIDYFQKVEIRLGIDNLYQQSGHDDLAMELRL